jgi:predicted aspartyl protease
VTKVKGLSIAQQVMLYTAGLASTLQIDLQLQQPLDLESAIAMARKFYLSAKQKELSPSVYNESLDIQISVNAVTGITTSQSMQVQLSINNRDFLALLDSGSTHNFIDSNTADTLQLPRTRAPNSLSVTVANGDRISNVGIYNNLTVQIDSEIFTIDCYSIKLGGYDFVLGVNWLRSLGPIIWDFNKLTMKFWRHGRQIIWHSLGKPRPAQPRLHTQPYYDNGSTPGQFLRPLSGTSRSTTSTSL